MAAINQGAPSPALFSLISSANLNDVDTYASLRDIFACLPATPQSQLAQFLSDRWAKRDT